MAQAVEDIRQRLQQIGYELHSSACSREQADQLRRERDGLEHQLSSCLMEKTRHDARVDEFLGELLAKRCTPSPARGTGHQ